MSLSRQERRAQERAQRKTDRRELKAQGVSTGPRTGEGKAVSSQNALRHGLTAAKLVLPGESQADFDDLLSRLTDEHDPQTVTETMYLREMAEQWWRLQRARNEEHSFECRAYELVTGGLDEKELDRLERVRTRIRRYATGFERGFHRAHRMLRAIQKERATREAERDADRVAAKAKPPSPDVPWFRPIRPEQFVSQNDVAPSQSADPSVSPSLSSPAEDAQLTA
jgi:hypothetical protein